LHPSIVAGSIDRPTPIDRAGHVAAGTCFALVERDDVIERDDAIGIAVIIDIIGADDANAIGLSTLSPTPTWVGRSRCAPRWQPG
jgi:hypothetical protein